MNSFPDPWSVCTYVPDTAGEGVKQGRFPIGPVVFEQRRIGG